MKTGRLLLGAAATGLLTATARAGRDIPDEIGGRPTGERLARMQRSPQWRDGRFHNRAGIAGGTPDGSPDQQRDALRRLWTERSQRRPGSIPLDAAGAGLPTSGLHLSWLGHASALVSMDGVNLLLDPVWSDRCSPSQHVGPKRLHPVPFALSALPRLAAVVISHDHYDHLDMATVRELVALQDCPFVVPLGIGAHLDRWGVPANRIVELDWDESVELDGVRLTSVESQHFSGRGLRRDGTLWSSWVFTSPAGRVYFSGDTGYFDGYAALGAAYGPFDVGLMAVGAYDAAWRAIHLNPEEAVAAASELGARLVVPIHWCTFTLAPHPWAEPVERLLTEAADKSMPVLVPRVGAPVDVAAPVGELDAWWR